MRPVKREWRYLTGLARTLWRVHGIAPGSANLVADDLERAVDRWRHNAAIRFATRELSYGAMDALANRYAHWAMARGLRRGEVVAILLPNRLEYLPLWFGLAKVGVVAALINYQLTGEALAHCLQLSGARHIVTDGSTTAAVRALATSGLEQWDLDTGLDAASLSAARPPRSRRAGLKASDTALLIYTSGTTRLPKAPPITHLPPHLYMPPFPGATAP